MNSQPAPTIGEIIATFEIAIQQLEETKASGRIQWTVINEYSLRECRRMLNGLEHAFKR